MNELTVVEFETSPHGSAHVSSLSEGAPYTVHGVALGADDVTVGQSGIKKLWPAEELKKAAETLKGTDLVVDHENNASGVVGRVTKSGYKEGTGVVYEAELFDDELGEKVKNGLLEVSIRGYHADVDSLQEDDETDAKIVEDIEFDNLSIVPTGAAPSNTLEMGEHAELSAAELSAFTETLDEAVLESIEPGMWVQWNGNHGITVSMEQDGEFEVDVYEDMDGTWRSTEETMMVPADDLSEWDVDEENVGAAPEKDSEENRHTILRAGMEFFDSKNDSMLEIAKVNGDKVLMSSEGEADDGSWYETSSTVYKELADGTYEYHDPEDRMPLVPSGMKFYSTANDSVLEVLSVTDDMATMSSMNEDDSWEKPVSEIITDLAEGELRIFHPNTEIEEMMGDVSIPMPENAQLLYKTQEQAMEVAEMLGLDETHPHELDGMTYHMPGETHKAFEKVMSSRTDTDTETEEMAADANYSRGDWVNWDTRNSTEIGKVVGSYTEGDDIPDIRGDRGMSPEGDEILYTLRLYKERDGTFHPIEGKPIAHYEDSVRSAEEPSNVSDSTVELGRSNVGQYEIEEEDWVQWYPSDTTEEHGFAVDVDDSGEDDESIVTIEVWNQNDDGEWETDGEEITKSSDEVEPWGNFPRKQEEFADAISGEDPRRAVKPSEEENADSEELISEQVKSALKDKAEKHNEEHGDEKGKEVTYRMLKNVFNRGIGAYQDSHREGMSAQQWSYARVNAFLYLVRNGNPENDQYTQDNDLLPEEHPKYNEDGDTEENAGGMNAPSWEDGQMVRWQVNPAMMGKIVHVDREKDIIMVEVMESGESGMESTGFTVTAGYSDLIPMDDEMAAATTRDVPTQSSEPSHDSSSINGLLERFMEQAETSEPSLADFLEWMDSEDLMVHRPEGAEEKYDSDKDLYDAHRGEPHRYTDAEEEQLAEGYNDYPQEAVENAQMALDAKEETDNPNNCGRETGWKRANQLANEETLTRAEVGKMSAFNRHRQNSEMDDDEGRADCGWMMWKAWGGDAGVDWANMKMEEIRAEAAMYDVPDEHKFRNKEDAMKKADELGIEGAHQMDDRWMPGETHEEYMDAVAQMYGSTSDSDSDSNSDSNTDIDSLMGWEMHEPTYDGTTEMDWSRPDMEDFDTDDMSEIAGHFLISSSGFPPENYGDLALPVVEPSGELNVNALAAVKGGRGAGAVDGLSEDMEETITEMMNELANDEFDRDWGMEEAQSGEIDGSIGRPTASKTVGGVKVLSGDDLQDGGKSEESDVDELTTYQITTMTSDIEEQVAELNEPVAVEQSEIEQLRDKADRFEEMSESLEALRERTDILDEVDRSQVEALAESDDPVVKESARFEELESEAEQVAGVYAAQLSEHYDAFSQEELTDKFSIEELREKYEDQFGSVEDLASSTEAEPRGRDASEESLEESAGASDDSAEELSEDVEAKQEEIRNKIFR